MKKQSRSLGERIIHAVSFEAIALVICAPTAAWLMDKSLFQMGALAIMLSTVAMLWNMIYNTGFDRFYLPGQPRSFTVRTCHALGFESGFILIGLPIAAWMLQVTLWEALMVEIGFFLFFLPYTIVFNACYDWLRARRLQLATEK